MTIQQVQATLERQTAMILQLRAEKTELASKVLELTQFQSLFSRLEGEIGPLKSLKSQLSDRVSLLETEIEATLQIVQSHAKNNSQLKKDLVQTLDLNDALTTEVENLQVDLDDARQALATQPKRSMGERLVAGKVAFLAIAAFTGALVVVKNPEAVKDVAVKALACVAEKASSGPRYVSAFFNKGIEIDLT